MKISLSVIVRLFFVASDSHYTFLSKNFSKSFFLVLCFSPSRRLPITLMQNHPFLPIGSMKFISQPRYTASWVYVKF